MVRWLGLAVMLAVVGPPLATVAAEPVPAPERLPFGRWTVVNGALDESAIVWSRCRSTDGAAGRWIAARPDEVVHPTYVVQLGSLQRVLKPAEVLTASPLVECLGDGGLPGAPEPAVPATAIVPPGARIFYHGSVTVQHVESPQASHIFALGLETGDAASSDAGGPVVLTAGRLLIFPASFTLRVDGSGGGITIVRPGTEQRPKPTTCHVVAYDAQNREHAVATEAQPCSELSPAERKRLIDDARAQFAREMP